ncbi:hydroxyacid dehydrogenase [Verminephrobacter aporrectodeae subsp. tuberculatae]|uniref:hydroxyacid dehydrogenase n=1 Tax=Verminephrobacter aporrectodeae TaxID=1110389 RepID=UPI002244881E|nr:hydroxyacid dehydrogenase [Verminephrobacter aporrectodeae]MCW8207786.1 hydroxyacid dehydrogenase [Verminephrobacter aporrectodeae subsp. tuberculatae]
MMPSDKTILLVPAPRKVADIFTENQLERLRALGELRIHDDGPPTQAEFEALAPRLQILIGQIDMPESRLRMAPHLRAIFNVEGNFLPNIDYGCAMSRGVRILNISPVFAEPVAEAALGMAIDLARGISRSDRYFREGTEKYGLDANRGAYSLRQQNVGFIGFGDLGRAIVPLLAPFHPLVKVHDPWLSREYIRSFGYEAATLEAVLTSSKIVFVVAGVTSENQGFLGREAFASMQAGASLVLVSRAGVVDFEAMLDVAATGHIRVATDVFPVEPLPLEHRARRADSLLLSPHQAGALNATLAGIGAMVTSDAELISRGLPPCLCKVAQPETVALLRSKPVDKS